MSAEADPSPAVELVGVRRAFRMGGGAKVEALRGCDLVVPTGRFVAVMGPSGSGKSTLLNLIGCIDTPSDGRVSVLGRDVSREPKAKLAQFRLARLGFVFQRFNLVDHLSAVENVALPLQYVRPKIGARDRLRRAADVLDDLGLSDRLHHRPDQLSGGEQQRVGIARALVNKPRLLLADEPTGELDSATSAEIVRVLGNLRQSIGATVVVVTHDPEVAGAADTIVRMVDGRVEG